MVQQRAQDDNARMSTAIYIQSANATTTRTATGRRANTQLKIPTRHGLDHSSQNEGRGEKIYLQ